MVNYSEIIHELINGMHPAQFTLLKKNLASFIGKDRSFTLRIEIVKDYSNKDSVRVTIMNRFIEPIFEVHYDSVCDKTKNLIGFFNFIKGIEFGKAIRIIENNNDEYSKEIGLFVDKTKNTKGDKEND